MDGALQAVNLIGSHPVRERALALIDAARDRSSAPPDAALPVRLPDVGFP
jgi:hypothetical protein